MQVEYRVMGTSAAGAMVATIEESSDPTLATSWNPAAGGSTMSLSATEGVLYEVRNGTRLHP